MNNLRKLVLSAMLIALGLILPFLTGQIPQIGNMLLPMHIPVFLCGLICSYKYGAAVGLILPILRSLIFSMPPMYPKAIYMALELCAYGFIVGFVYMKAKQKNLLWLYISIISAMVGGRIVYGIAKALLLGISGSPLTFGAFISGGFIEAIPGIILQLILIPAVFLLVKRKE